MLLRSMLLLSLAFALPVCGIEKVQGGHDKFIIKARDYHPPVLTGNEPLLFAPGPERTVPRRNALDTVGVVYRAGDTYYDYQHNGTVGRMIGVDDLGYVHVVWMRGFSPSQQPRHVFYNIWDPATQAFVFPEGVQVDGGTRGGYTCLGIIRSGENGGWCLPAFHQVVGDPSFHAAAAIDYAPGSGTFTASTVPFLRESGVPREIMWPKAAVGRDSALHLVSTQNVPGPWDPQRIFYSRGIPQWDADGFGVNIEWQIVDRVNGVDVYFKLIDSVMTINPVIEASKRSDRVVIAYARSRDNMQDPDERTEVNNDLYMIVSEDGGLNWGTPRNVTQFIPPDTVQQGDGDTLRLFTDCAAIFDQNDVIHLAFAARTYRYYNDEGEVGPWSYYGLSGIWHVNETCEEFSPVALHYHWLNDSGSIDPGGWQTYVQRPCFALDTLTNDLYCVYQQYMPGQWSDQGWHMADVFVSTSCNNGRVWSEGVNITDTNPGRDIPPPGSESERDPSCAEFVTYTGDEGFLHVFYIFDRDAGGFPQDEGTAVLCDADYQRVPVSAIPSNPVVNPFWPPFHVDGRGVPNIAADDTAADRVCHIRPCWSASDPEWLPQPPRSFVLYQNYPNPFNPATMIQFDLARDALVTLGVYNVLGQSVVTLLDQKPLPAGTHSLPFDGSLLPSGIYLYRLATGGHVAVRKMVLLK